MSYAPRPIDTSGVVLSDEGEQLTEALARNTHERWAEQRLRDGWARGPRRDDEKKEHPGLVPYEELPESDKQYDRVSAMETIRAIVALGYKIVPPDRSQNIGVDALTAADEALDAVSDYLRDTASLDMSVLSALWKKRRAARTEPITPPGEVYASQAYAAFVALRPASEIACVYVGNTPWAKGYGSFPTFHVRRTHRR